MEIIYVMIGISIALAVFFLFSFLWASKSGQFDDDESPSVRILFDEKPTTDNKPNKQIANGSGKV
ncbi:MAG: cbb3-type cytochrome oxidase assembly protein CcoS [Flavobacteriales bacterium]